MKLWFNYGSEHSSDIVLIGHFKKAADAQAFEQDLENLKRFLQESPKYQSNILSFDPSIKEYLVREEISFLSPEQLDQILSYELLKRDGTKIKVNSDEFLDGLVSWMITKGAKIEIFSLHDYPEEK